MTTRSGSAESIIFVSYRRRDSRTEATQLHRMLSHRYGADRVFIDVGTSAGVDWPAHIRERLDAAAVLLVVIGHNWMESVGSSDVDWVATEVAEGLAQPHTTVIPVFVGGVDEFPKPMPESVDGLTDRMAHRLRPDSFEPDVEALFEVLDQQLPARLASRRSFRWVAVGVALVAGLALWALNSSDSSELTEVAGTPTSVAQPDPVPTEPPSNQDPTPADSPDPTSPTALATPEPTAEPTSVPTAVSPVAPTPGPTVGLGEVDRSVETWAMATHPNGSQLFVTDVRFQTLRTTVSFEAINGRGLTTTFNGSDSTTQLVDANGNVYAPLERSSQGIEGNQTGSFEVAFEPLPPDTNTFQVQSNLGPHDDQSIDEYSPGFAIDIDLGTEVAIPELPPAVGISGSAVTEGVSVYVRGIGFTPTSIAAAVTITNASQRDLRFSLGRHGAYLEDDLGNRYWLRGEGTESTQVRDGREVTANLVFGGRIHPDATTLTMVLNTGDSVLQPRVELGPWTIDGSFPGDPFLGSLAINERLVHPNRSALTLRELVFSDTSTAADLVIDNPSQTAIVLVAGDSYLLDDLDNRYYFEGPLDNDRVRVERGTTAKTQLFIPGRFARDATSVWLVFNDRDEGDADNPETIYPELRFGPYTIVTSRPANPPAFVVNTSVAISEWASVPAERSVVSVSG